jgi:hypothetical protein
MLTWSANLDEVSSAEHTQGEVLPAGGSYRRAVLAAFVDAFSLASGRRYVFDPVNLRGQFIARPISEWRLIAGRASLHILNTATRVPTSAQVDLRPLRRSRSVRILRSVSRQQYPYP